MPPKEDELIRSGLDSFRMWGVATSVERLFRSTVTLGTGDSVYVRSDRRQCVCEVGQVTVCLLVRTSGSVTVRLDK